MSYSCTKDFLIEVAKGNVTGHSLVHKFGRNPDIPMGSWEHVSQVPFDTANFRQAAGTFNVQAGGDAEDGVGGDGAREVTIQGIVATTFLEETDVLTTAGIGASLASAKSFWRVHRAWVSEAGVYTAANTAAIIIEDVANNDMITIAIEEGQSQYAGFTIPAGKTGYLLSVHVTVDSLKTADVRCFTRNNIDDVTPPLDSKRLRLYWDGIGGTMVYKPLSPELSLAEKTDIWFEGNGAAAAAMSVDFELLLVDD
jgi:hypothetical protein